MPPPTLVKKIFYVSTPHALVKFLQAKNRFYSKICALKSGLPHLTLFFAFFRLYFQHFFGFTCCISSALFLTFLQFNFWHFFGFIFSNFSAFLQLFFGFTSNISLALFLAFLCNFFGFSCPIFLASLGTFL